MPRRREGPVLNRQTGYYFFDQILGFKPNKQRVRVSLGTKDPAKARFLWEQEYRRRWAEYYGLESPVRPALVSFKKLAQEFVDFERDIKRVKEWKTLEDRLNIISALWGDISFNEITRDQIAALDSWLREHDRSESTINHYFKLLKQIFNYAIKKKQFTGESPLNDVKPYVVDQKRRAYSAEEMEKIIDAGARIEKEARSFALIQKYAKRIVLLLFYTGMRIGELLNLKWENVQDDVMVFKRTETKQRKEKVIPITAPIRELLDSIERKGEYVLPLRRRGPMRTAFVDSLIKRIREYTGIPDFVFHNIRHTASTILVSEALGRGVGLADVMKILGHSKVETTMKYVHSDMDRMRKAVEILGEKAKKNN